MLKLLSILALILALVMSTAAVPVQGETLEQIDTSEFSSGSVKGGMFIENVGQFPAQVRFQFLALGDTDALWLTDEALWATLSPNSGDHGSGTHVKITFTNANPHPTIEPFNPLDAQLSYFRGSNPANWRPDAPVWGGVRYRDLYPGVNVEFTAPRGQLTPRLTCHADCDRAREQVRMRVEGAEDVRLDGDVLRLSGAGREFLLPLLAAASATEGSPNVLSTPATDGAQTFEVAAPFTVNSPDMSAKPSAAAGTLHYSTFLGGGQGNDDEGYAIAVDSRGAAYVTGYVQTSDFPSTPGAFDPLHNNCCDAFVAKLSPDGSQLVYGTFLSGEDLSEGSDIAVDQQGNAYVTGRTLSPDFPTTPGALDTTFSGEADGFVVKLNPNGSSLIFATYLGGGGYDYALSIALDLQGNAYLTGSTDSPDFPVTPGVFDVSHNGGSDAFVAKLNGAGSALVYASYLGGTDFDFGTGIAVDQKGAAYAAGATSSADFPITSGAVDGSIVGLSEAFVIKVSPAGIVVNYATFLGGSSYDGAVGIAVDRRGQAYVAGGTFSSDFPVTFGAYDTTFGGWEDAFIARLNPSGTALTFATYLGGSSADSAYDLAINAQGEVFAAGWTFSENFPTTPDAFNPSFSGGDAFVIQLSADGSQLPYGSYLGNAADLDFGIAVHPGGLVYVTGKTYDADFPTTPNAYDPTYNGSEGDVFVSCLQLK